jgi:succinoglycan biosynthesis transport protein ExoP
LRGAIGQVQSGLKVTRLGASYFIDVSYSHSEPKTAASIANAVAESYLDEQLEARYQAAQRAATWLSDRVGELRVQLEKSERALAEHRAKFNLAKPQAGTLADQQAGEINAQLVAARAQTVEKKAKYDQAQRILEGGAGIETVAAVMDSGAISGLRVQEAAVARQEADLLTRYGPEHPAILKVRAERADLARQIKREVGRVVQTLRTDYEFAQKKEQSLENSLQELTGGADHDEQPIIRLRELEREAESNRNLYQSMLARFKEVQQQTTPTAAESRIVTPAFVPGAPSYPSKTRFMLIALCAGLAFGAGLVYLLEYLENGFTSVEQVEQALQLPVMATILRVPDSERRIDGRTVSIPEYTALRPLSRLGEGVRSARMTIQMSNIDRPPKVVMMTSAQPGEGKTTMAVSFAVSTAASTKQQVLLIDGDLRARSLSKEFKLSDKAGLTDLLMEQFPADRVLFRAEGSNLAVLPAGTTATNPPDLLGSERMRSLMENLSAHFDVIYVDAPPLLPVIDAAVLASIADKVVFVVHWRSTPRSVVPRALQLLDNSRRKVCGVILNGVRAEQLANYDPQNAYYHGKYQGYYAQ